MIAAKRKEKEKMERCKNNIVTVIKKMKSLKMISVHARAEML